MPPTSLVPVWRWVRRVVIFFLGCAVILEGIISAQDRVVELIAGMVMVGVLPLDDLLRSFHWGNGRRRPDDDTTTYSPPSTGP